MRSGRVCSRCVPSRSNVGYRCEICHSPADEEAACDLCRLFPTIFASIRSLWEYSGRAKELITAMKYRPSMALAREGGRMLRTALPELFGAREWDAIVPIPSSRQSMRVRGFNQCEVLAKALETRTPVLSALLQHRGYRSVQAALPHERRLANVKSAFRIAPRRRVPGRILLVDDVLTTGATASAAAATLSDAGAITVDLLCLARSPSWSDHRHELYCAWPGRRIADKGTSTFRKGRAAVISSECPNSPQSIDSPS